MSANNRLYLTLISLAALVGCQRAQSQPPAGPPVLPPPEVEVATPEIRDFADFEDFTGHLEAKEMVQIRARVSGYLDHVFFEDGAEVAKDAPLFQIDPRPYQDDLANKEALVTQSERHVERLTADFDRAAKACSRRTP